MGADPRPVREGSARPYAILIPPPNVTGRLHLGHALNNTLQDVLIRAHRMKGFQSLWMPGTDHAGIATQAVVEKRLLETENKRRTDYTRDEFVAKVQAWKDEYERTATEQLRAMGCSCDYRRQRFTMDPVCARAVREAFFQLFKASLIYRGKRLVNWDPVTQTALADDEVEMVEVDGAFYYLRYPLAHPWDHDDEPTPVTWSELAARGYPGAERRPDEEQAWITVATTRPETYLGDTAVAVNPRDPRAKALRDFCIQLPLVGRAIPIIEDEYVVMPDPESSDAKAKHATGFLKVTPAHDPNDYEIGQRHHLPIINVMAPDGSISDKYGWDDLEETEGAHVFLGRSREEARKLVVREFEARGLLEDTRPHRHTVGHSYRSHAPIEPYFTDQWYVQVTDDRLRGVAQRALNPEQRSAESLAAWPDSKPGGPALRAGSEAQAGGHGSESRAAGDGSMSFYPPRYAKTYEMWHDNLRDWCISRQLWWGHRIPVWVAPDDGGAGATSIGDDRVCVRTFNGRMYACVRDSADTEAIAKLERAGWEQDPDVLDTWFSSALWPLSTMGWPDPEQAARDTGIDDFPLLRDAFNPTTVLCTAREIITLWVSRMVMFNRFFQAGAEADDSPGPAPFRDVFIHAMIQDGEGRKMSKSLGNGVDPLAIIESHGADAMRFTLCKMTTQTQDVRMPVQRDPASGKNTSPKFDEGRSFCNKIWNAARFALGILAEAQPAGSAPVDAASLPLPDRWMLSRLRESVRACDAALADYQFSAYAQTLYDIFWRDFCDWYLEAIKPTVRSSPPQQAALRATLDCLLRLLHPVAPFLTEAIYERFGAIQTAPVAGLHLAPSPAGAGGLLLRAPWPLCDDTLHDDGARGEFDRIKALAGAIREVRAQQQISPRRQITLHAPQDLAEELAVHAQLLLSFAGTTLATDPPTGPAAAISFEQRELRLGNLADVLDAGAERDRLLKKIDELSAALEHLDKRLANPGYIDRAPAHLVQQTRSEREAAAADLGAARKALESVQ